MRRRHRTPEQRSKLYNSIIYNFRRFFPRGPAPMLVREYWARVASGRYRPPKSINTPNRRRFREGYYPQLLSGEWIRLDEERTGRLPDLEANWRTHRCGCCRRKFWICGPNSRYEFCSYHCREIVRLHAFALAFDPTALQPETLEFRWWCLTHPYPGRPASSVSNTLIPSLEFLMRRTDLVDYLQEKLPLTKEQEDALRERYLKVISTKAHAVSEALSGRDEWSLSRTRLFLGLLDRLLVSADTRYKADANLAARRLPDTKQKTIEHDPQEIASMSRSDLESLLSDYLSSPKAGEHDLPRHLSPEAVNHDEVIGDFVPHNEPDADAAPCLDLEATPPSGPSDKETS